MKFQANFNLNFRSLLVNTPFFWPWLHFNPAFFITLRTVAVLIDGEIPALTTALFTLYFPISSCSTLAWCKMFLSCLSESFVGLPWFCFRLSGTRSLIFCTMCLQIVALEYFPYDFIVDNISNQVFLPSCADNASELIPLLGFFVKLWSLISSFLYWFSMHLKKKDFWLIFKHSYCSFHYTKMYRPKWNININQKSPNFS